MTERGTSSLVYGTCVHQPGSRCNLGPAQGFGIPMLPAPWVTDGPKWHSGGTKAYQRSTSPKMNHKQRENPPVQILDDLQSKSP
jgi:hypothetical protein